MAPQYHQTPTRPQGPNVSSFLPHLMSTPTGPATRGDPTLPRHFVSPTQNHEREMSLLHPAPTDLSNEARDRKRRPSPTMEKDYQPKRQKSGDAQHFVGLEQNTRSQTLDQALGRLSTAPDLSTPEQDTPERSSESSDDNDASSPSTKAPASEQALRRPPGVNVKPIEKSFRFGRSYHAVVHENSMYYIQLDTLDRSGRFDEMFTTANFATWDLHFNLDIHFGTNSTDSADDANDANNLPSGPSITLNGRIIKGRDPHNRHFIHHPISCTWPASQLKNFKWKQQIGPPHGEEGTIHDIYQTCTDKTHSLVALYILEWNFTSVILKGFEDGSVDRAYDAGGIRGRASDVVEFMKAAAMNRGRMMAIVPRDTFSEAWERHTLEAMKIRLRGGHQNDEIPVRTRSASAPRLRARAHDHDGPADESHIVDMTGVDSPTTSTLSSAASSDDTEDSAAGADLEQPLRRGNALYDIDGNLVLLEGVVDAAENETEEGTPTATTGTPPDPAPYPENNIDIDDVDAEDKGKVASSPRPLISTAKKAMSALLGKGSRY